MPFWKSPWLRASLHGTPLLGVLMIALIWSATTIYLRSNKQADLATARQETSNLARAFEEHIARTIRGVDNTLIILRSMYEADRKSFNLVDWPGDHRPNNGAILHYSIIDASGRLIESSRKPVEALDLSHRDHFRFQKDATGDELFIGRPVEGIRSAKTSIQLNRRLRNPDGSFAGIIVASLDTENLVKFYQTINIGREGSISLIGLDGYVRAQRGFKDENIAKLNPNRGVLRQLEKSPAGYYVNDGQFDGVIRCISYRKVADLPLAVLVGFAEHEVLANHYANQFRYYGLAGGITALILIVIALSVQHQRKLDRAYDWLRNNETTLRTSRQKLRTTLDNIDQGILMADAQGNVEVINSRFVELLELPQEWLSRKISMQQIVSFLFDRGEYGADGELLDRQVWETIKDGGLNGPIRNYERVRPNGRILEIRARSLPDGGIVRTFTDITERKRAEAKIAQMATHDDLTGLTNRALFRQRITQALSRTQRYDERFSVLLFDLDRFKSINDTHGHPAGDAVLVEIARRLSACVREFDTVARLGGDEFAVLQARIASDDDAAQLARRIIRSIRTPFELDGTEIALATSVGIAVAPRDGTDYDQLIKAADHALYRAKDGGGGRFRFYEAAVPVQDAPATALGLTGTIC